jgi:orotate phosphoribosyltransferase
MDSDRERLRALLRQHSLMFGAFTLASGKTSSFYFDSKRTTLLPEGALLTARQVLQTLRENRIDADAIGGMSLGADPIVCPVAALSQLEGCPLRAFIVRREPKGHGTARQLEGSLDPGSRVVIVDDVVTTGRSTLRAIEAAEREGHRVVAVVCLVDREEGGRQALARWPFYALFRGREIFGEGPGEKKP